MILLALLLALGAERLMSTRRDGGSVDSPLVRLWQLLPKPLRDAPFATWLLAFALAGLVALIGSSLSGGLTQLAYATAALFVCLGPRDLADDVQRLRAARAAGDAATVARLTRSLQRGPAPDADHRSLLGALFIQSHERRFGACLWFIVGGPAGGAVLYRIASRLSALVETPSAQRSAALLHNLLAWLPARLTALLFGLAGSMDDALDALKRVQREAPTAGSDGWQPRTWSLLAEAANASLDWEDAPGSGPMIASSLDATLAEVLRMETRATLILLALVALFTAGVWVA